MYATRSEIDKVCLFSCSRADLCSVIFLATLRKLGFIGILSRKLDKNTSDPAKYE